LEQVAPAIDIIERFETPRAIQGRPLYCSPSNGESRPDLQGCVV